VTAVLAGTRVARSAVCALDALGRARLTRDGFAGRAARLHAACSELAVIHGLQLDIRGEWPDGAAVIVTNHVGYLDPIAIASALPCAPIAKAEVAAWPIIGSAAGGLGAIYVSRDSVWSRARAMRRALGALRAGVPVLNFPEGTTTDGSRLLPFARGIFGIARLARVPVIPVAVRCSRELAWHGNAPFVPHYLMLSRMAAPAMRLDIGAPIDSTRFASAEELAAVAYHRIAHALGFSPPIAFKVAS
jgi:1-acyl-sn-glycerol-3-phosphate acyltransferase